MRFNQNIAISLRDSVLLVPYEASHVKTYHEWMQDPAIQAATASEPLSLNEEHQMQRSWRSDTDKLTFIIAQPLTSPKTTTSTLPPFAKPTISKFPPSFRVVGGTHDTPSLMLGDINLFISYGDSGLVGEIELMIAPQSQRGRGYGRATLVAFLHYITINEAAILAEYRNAPPSPTTSESLYRELQLKVKIGKDNVKSLNLFQSLGFRKLSEEPNYFDEFELDLVERAGKGWTTGLINDAYQEISYVSDGYVYVPELEPPAMGGVEENGVGVREDEDMDERHRAAKRGRFEHIPNANSKLVNGGDKMEGARRKSL